MSNIAIQSSTESPPPQARSTIWALSALVGLCVVDFIDIAQDATSGASYIQPIVEQYGPLPAFLVGAAPRLVVYLVGLWLFRKQSAWAILPALMVAIPRAIFSDGAIRSLMNGAVPHLVDAAALLFVLAVFVTSLWFVIELRQSNHEGQSEQDDAK